MNGDIEHWKSCLVSSIQLFCRNFCQYDTEARIDGLLAITLDKKEVILVKLQETDNNGTASDKIGPSNLPSKEQSEKLESILRYLAPSCRLLKKAPVRVSTTLPPVWKPVCSDSLADTPERCAFLRSLGLVPTARQPPSSSCVTRLRATVGIADSSYGQCESQDRLQAATGGFSPTAQNDFVNARFSSDKFSEDGSSLTRCRTGVFTQASYYNLSNTKTDANGNDEPIEDVKCFNLPPLGVKLKTPLTASNSANCSTDLRVCLDLNSVNLMMKNQQAVKMKSNSAHGSSVFKKSTKLMKKNHHIVNKTSRIVSNSKSLSKSGKNQSKAGLGNVRAKGNVTEVCSKNSIKKAPGKSKTDKAKGPSTFKKTSFSLNSVASGSEASNSKRKDSTKSSTLLAGNLKKKIASRKLLNKTKASQLKKLCGQKSAAKKKSHEMEFDQIKRAICGKCCGCKVKENCGVCIFCKDKKQYGGPNKLHKKCLMRQCRLLSKKKNNKSYGSKLHHDRTPESSTTD